VQFMRFHASFGAVLKAIWKRPLLAIIMKECCKFSQWAVDFESVLDAIGSKLEKP